MVRSADFRQRELVAVVMKELRGSWPRRRGSLRRERRPMLDELLRRLDGTGPVKVTDPIGVVRGEGVIALRVPLVGTIRRIGPQPGLAVKDRDGTVVATVDESDVLRIEQPRRRGGGWTVITAPW